MNKKLVEIATQIMVMAVIVSVVLLFIGIGVLFLIHVCIVGRAFRRGLGTDARTRNNGAQSGLVPEDLEMLPCYDFKVGEDGAGGAAEDCAVCLESFQQDDRCRLLPACRHSFHAQCVDSWLMKSPLCPTCRTSTACPKGGKAADGEPDRGGDGFGFEVVREGRREGVVMVEIPSTAAQQPSPALAPALEV